MNIHNLKNFLAEDLPNLVVLYSEESLSRAFSLLKELLNEERIIFENFCRKDFGEISFSDWYSHSVLSQYYGILSHYHSVQSNETIRSIIKDFQPLYTDFSNEIMYSKDCYDRIVYLFNESTINEQQKRILKISIDGYEKRGIHLDTGIVDEIKNINKEIAQKTLSFNTNVLDDKAKFSIRFDNEDFFSELPIQQLKSARKRATDKSISGLLFDASYESYSSVMKYCSDKVSRKKMLDARALFATKGEFSNKQLAIDIIDLRQKKAKIIGYESHAEFVLKNRMAQSEQEVVLFTKKILDAAVRKGKEELDILQDFYSLGSLSREDIAWWMRKYKEDKIGFNEQQWREHFELDQTLKGMFSCAEKLFGVQFKEIFSQEMKYNEDVCLYEVWKDGTQIARYLTDLFYRSEKSSGAWANTLVERHHLQGIYKKPIVLNVGNFAKNSEGKTLLSPVESETLFHEFGHALHVLLSSSKYSSLNGFHTEWDFIELPSQLMEQRVKEKESLLTFAFHYKDGSPLPDSLYSAYIHKDLFGTGQRYIIQCQYSLVDMMMYGKEDAFTNSDILEQKIEDILDSSRLLPYEYDTLFYCSFLHVFSGGYSAGYYSYLRSEILDAQVHKTFIEKGMFSSESADHYYQTILSKGATKPAHEIFVDFSKEGIDESPFLKRTGLIS